ncbi:MAG: NAD(P)/FAD-dependent oxidoreductase [Alphaproteobacteria bacterium]
METTIERAVRPELLKASDEVIEDAVKYADPMVLRGLIYQLTGDPELLNVETRSVLAGIYEGRFPANGGVVAFLQRKAVDFLKSYRDSGAGDISIGPKERLAKSLRLLFDDPMPDEDIGMYIEELALDHWARELRWKSKPDAKALNAFSVTIIGAGMGGLNAALQLKRAGIPYTMIEKNDGVGGTWYENRYPGARVDTPSRGYTHLFGVDFGYPNPFCDWTENVRYFDWVADNFGLREGIQFKTEVLSMAWDEEASEWEIRLRGPGGERTHRSRAVITGVGFLNRPNLPEFEGANEFKGKSWHTSRWPEDVDLTALRVAVIGTGATGYQMIPELALEAHHVTVFQRTPQWLFPVNGYRSPFPPQIGWLDRNLPYHTNFMRGRASDLRYFTKMATIDPEFSDPWSSANNKAAREASIAFMMRKLGDPELVKQLTPPHSVLAARPIVVDPEYSVLDAVGRSNVTLVQKGVKRINATGIETEDGTQHDVDVIVYATGFHATEYLFPMTITGRGGKTIDELWAKDGARAYLGCMMPGFPNLWTIYGPNTNGCLPVAAFHEMVNFFAMQCMEKLILDGKKSVDVTENAYWRYNQMIDDCNRKMVWSDQRAQNYYWDHPHNRSAVMNPLPGPQMWRYLSKPDFEDMDFSPGEA